MTLLIFFPQSHSDAGNKMNLDGIRKHMVWQQQGEPGKDGGFRAQLPCVWQWTCYWSHSWVARQEPWERQCFSCFFCFSHFSWKKESRGAAHGSHMPALPQPLAALPGCKDVKGQFELKDTGAPGSTVLYRMLWPSLTCRAQTGVEMLWKLSELWSLCCAVVTCYQIRNIDPDFGAKKG